MAARQIWESRDLFRSPGYLSRHRALDRLHDDRPAQHGLQQISFCRHGLCSGTTSDESFGPDDDSLIWPQNWKLAQEAIGTPLRILMLWTWILDLQLAYVAIVSVIKRIRQSENCCQLNDDFLFIGK